MDELSSDKRAAVFRAACREDIYFLLRYVTRKLFAEKLLDYGLDFFYGRCKRVDDIELQYGSLDGWLFLWPREHCKSMIINTGKNIQSILRDPERCRAIFSNTGDQNKGSKVFLSEIKADLENNEMLKFYFSAHGTKSDFNCGYDILWDDVNHAEQWSIDRGLSVKRQSSRKEATIAAYGLVDSSPTKIHCEEMTFDDVVTKESVETEHMIEKTRQAMSLSVSLGTNIGGNEGTRRYAGTRYADGDYYGDMIDSGAYNVDIVRWHNGDGETPLLMTKKRVEYLRSTMSKYDFNTQYELDPTPMGDRKFYSPLTYYKEIPGSLNYIILVDPAGVNKKNRGHDPDNTAIAVIGRDWLGHEFFVDGFYGNIKLVPRINLLFNLVRRYRVEEIWYERFGKDSDISSLMDYQSRTGLYFTIHEYTPRIAKQQRIEAALMPRLETQKLRFPHEKRIKRPDGTEVELIGVIKDEMKRFPHGKHDDMIDCLAQLAAVPQYGSDIPPGMPSPQESRILGTYHEHLSDMEVRERKQAETEQLFKVVEYL